MKTYQLHLKGTKIRKSTDATIELKAINKSQAFNIAYYFFEKGTELPFMSEFFDVKAVQELKGRYRIGQSSVVCL